MPRSSFTPVTPPRRGFSLVLSLVVMAMLLLLCISAAALLAIELRVSRVTISHAKARLNALAGARIALGTIQGLAGTDRAVSANAAILATDAGKSAQVRRPRLPGVWRSAVVSADYDNAHTSAFKGWLMSGNDASGLSLAARGSTNAVTGVNWMLSGAADKATDEWLLLDGGRTPYAGSSLLREDFDDSPGSREPLRLYGRPEYIAGDSSSAGAFAWVATDENQKARVDLREFSSTDASQGGFADNDRAIFSAAAASRFYPGYAADGTRLKDWSPTSVVRDGRLVGGWVSLPLDPNGKQSLDTGAQGWFPLETDNVTPARALRHDFTLESGSLLTDTINGGLKRDLNTFALMSDSDFTGEATIRFGDALGLVGMDTDRSDWYSASSSPAVSGLFPLSGNTKLVWPSWADVRSWAKMSTDGTLDNSGSVTRISWKDMQSVLGDPSNLKSSAKNAAWRQPVLSRIRFEMALQTQPSGATNSVVYFKLNVVAQVWNPFNVKMKMPDGGYFINMKNLPFISRWYKTDPSSGAGGNGTIPNTFYMAVPLGGADMEPGEVRTFSLKPTSPQTISDYTAAMIPGYVPSGGYVSSAVQPAIASTDIVTYSTGRFTNPAEIPGGSVNGYSTTPGGGNGSFYIFASDTNPVDGPTAPAEMVSVIGALDNKWIVTPGNTPTTVSNVGPASSIPVGAARLCSVFEYRLKPEKLPVTPGRFSPPPLMYQGGWSWPVGTASNVQDLRACPFELVGWNPEPQKDAERFANSMEVPAPVAGNTGGYAHTGNTLATGITKPIFYHLPLTPPVGLGDLRNARLGGGLRVLSLKLDPINTVDAYPNAYATVAPFSNSLASAFVPLDKVYLAKGNLGGSGGSIAGVFTGPDSGVRPTDHAWVMNTALADTWFASSLGNWNQGATAALFSFKKDYATQFRDFFNSGLPLPNRRFSPLTVTDAETKWVSGTNATKDAYRQVAQGMLVEGGFNINSTSTRAWRAFLASSRDSKTVKQLAGALTAATSANTGVALPASVVNEDPVPTGTAASAANNAKRVSGGRDLSDADLDNLSVALVAEVKKRGPFLSLGEFLNRRVETGALGYKGAVQAAIDTAKLNDHRTTTGMASTPATTVLGNPDVDKVYDYSGVGQPGWLSQGDLIAPLLPSMTPRGDTFTIRVAGESEDGARAYCEITVRRTYAFVDGRDAVDAEFNPTTGGTAMRSVNKAFGRRFAIVSQRWLTREQI